MSPMNQERWPSQQDTRLVRLIQDLEPDADLSDVARSAFQSTVAHVPEIIAGAQTNDEHYKVTQVHFLTNEKKE